MKVGIENQFPLLYTKIGEKFGFMQEKLVLLHKQIHEMEGWNMSYNATGNSAGRRISLLLDEGSFVEIGGAVTARNTDFNPGPICAQWFNG